LAPALPTNIRLSWESLPGTNTYLKKLVNYGLKSFIVLAPSLDKTITFIIKKLKKNSFSIEKIKEEKFLFVFRPHKFVGRHGIQQIGT
jgi:hypothetical protein